MRKQKQSAARARLQAGSAGGGEFRVRNTDVMADKHDSGTGNPLEALLVNQADIPRLRAREADQERIKRLPKLTAVGQRVRFNKLAHDRRVPKPGRATTGTVDGESRDGKTLYVLFDGQPTRRCYATEYLELDS